MSWGEYYKLKPCPVCKGTNIDIDSAGGLEIYGVCYQSGWVSCQDCGNELYFEFNDKIDSKLPLDWKDMIDVWNAGVIYDGEISDEL